MLIYDQDSKALFDILRSASSEQQGATLLVPDLQRPYVWNPNQVTLLVDSLLRGWPFGTLLPSSLVVAPTRAESREGVCTPPPRVQARKPELRR